MPNLIRLTEAQKQRLVPNWDKPLDGRDGTAEPPIFAVVEAIVNEKLDAPASVRSAETATVVPVKDPPRLPSRALRAASDTHRWTYDVMLAIALTFVGEPGEETIVPVGPLAGIAAMAAAAVRGTPDAARALERVMFHFDAGARGADSQAFADYLTSTPLVALTVEHAKVINSAWRTSQVQAHVTVEMPRSADVSDACAECGNDDPSFDSRLCMDCLESGHSARGHNCELCIPVSVSRPISEGANTESAVA